KAMPDRIPAAHHALLGGAVVFFGIDPATKRRFVVQSVEGGGWGGRPFEDGESATVSVCQGDVRNGSIEGIEMKCPVLIEERASRAGCPPWGLWGGLAGASGGYDLRKPGDGGFRAMFGSQHAVPRDCTVVVRTGGGGGWGDPLERDPGRVREDAIEELVSIEAAREQYGVVLGADFAVDAEATAALRARKRSGKQQRQPA